MKRPVFFLAILGSFAAAALAQTMTGSSTMTQSNRNAGKPDASGMMAAPAQGAGSGPGGAAMSADPKAGGQLRAAKSSGMKTLFVDLKSAEALAANAPTVLFFAADWDTSSQAELRDINKNGSRLGKVNVVVVDFDGSGDLKAKYGVTAQASYVQIDSTGARLAIWRGGGVDGILGNLVKTR